MATKLTHQQHRLLEASHQVRTVFDKSPQYGIRGHTLYDLSRFFSPEQLLQMYRRMFQSLPADEKRKYEVFVGKEIKETERTIVETMTILSVIGLAFFFGGVLGGVAGGVLGGVISLSGTSMYIGMSSNSHAIEERNAKETALGQFFMLNPFGQVDQLTNKYEEEYLEWQEAQPSVRTPGT